MPKINLLRLDRKKGKYNLIEFIKNRFPLSFVDFFERGKWYLANLVLLTVAYSVLLAFMLAEKILILAYKISGRDLEKIKGQ